MTSVTILASLEMSDFQQTMLIMILTDAFQALAIA